MPSKTKIPKTFKISQHHQMMLNTSPYNKAPGLLIGMLLDALFDGELPAISRKFVIKVANRTAGVKNGN